MLPVGREERHSIKIRMLDGTSGESETERGSE